MSRTRLLAGVGLLALLAAGAGCAGVFGPGPVDEERLARQAAYEWNTSADATIRVGKTEYTAVYRIDGRSTFEVYRRDSLGTETPVELAGLQFRYPNGTVVRLSADRVEKTRKRTIIDLPAERGQVAFTAPKRGKRFATPTLVEGSYEVVLPPGARVGVPLLAQVGPGGYAAERVGDRVHLRWRDVEAPTIVVRYYLARDLLLFGGLAAVLVAVGVVGVAYYLREIRQLERRRREVGLDVDTDDDEFRRRPPPGMG